MNRVAATANQIENFSEPVLPTGNLDRSVRVEAKMDQAGNVGKIETAETIIVGYVEKNGIV